MELTESNLLAWMKEQGELCGKVATMKKLCDAFPDDVIIIKQSWPPFDFQNYNSEAAKLLNKLKEEGKIGTEKKGRSWCFKAI